MGQDGLAENRVASIQAQLEDLGKSKEHVSGNILEILKRQEAKLVRELSTLSKKERAALCARVETAHDSSFRYKVVPRSEYEAALAGRTKDERARALMDGAKKLGVTLQSGEIVVIKRASGVDRATSVSLTAEYADDLQELGGDFVVMATKGGGSNGTMRGDLSAFPHGTRLTKDYKGAAYAAEVVEKDGSKAVVGTAGEAILGKQFPSLSGAASAITGYHTNGKTWWSASFPDSKGSKDTNQN